MAYYTIEYNTSSADFSGTWNLAYPSQSGPISNSSLQWIIPETSANTTFIRVYESGSSTGSADIYSLGKSKINFKSKFTLVEHKYVCIVKAGEFNRSTNPTLYDNSGSLILQKYIYDTNDDLTLYKNENLSPYVTAIGLYDENDIPIAYAKLGKPLKLEKSYDNVFIIKFDL